MTHKVLVTGGAGYIGAHACRALAEAGFTPVVFDRLVTGHRDFVRWGPLVEGDVRDREALEAVMAAHRPSIVLHFAALSQVGESVREPELYWSINLGGAVALLTAMRAKGIQNLVFSSTAAVYGAPDAMPIPETAPTRPVSPYGQTKLAAEWLMASAEQAWGLHTVRLRYFNACGADPEALIGEDHSPETHLIPLALHAVLGLRPALSVFGADYETADGTAIRDYIHVCDLADAHVAAARHLIGGGGSATLNIGTGSGASVAEVLNMVEKVTCRAVPHEITPRRAGDPPALVADPSMAIAALDWHATRSLEDAVADAWRWHQRRFGSSAAARQAP